MKPRVRSIIGWIATILVVLLHIPALMGKFIPPEPGSVGAQMSDALGMTPIATQLGILEIIVLVLFIVPRTSTVGFVLMVGYMGGVLATILTHGMTSLAETFPMYIAFIVLMISAYFRNPELLTRIRKGNAVADTMA
jgi:hypothetical protein